jgi:hypothetical protein
MGGMGGMGGGLFGFGGGVKDDDGLLMRDDKLAALGKAIRLVEADVKKSEEDEAKTWATTTKPKLEKVAIGRGMFIFYTVISRPPSLFSSDGPQQIAELEKKCAALRNRIDVEGPRKGLEHVATLEDELRPLNESLEGAKKALLLPHSAVVLGQGGVYAGFDDLWLEQASGQLAVALVPHKDAPRIQVTLSDSSSSTDTSGGEGGTKGNTAKGGNGESGGLTVRLKAEGFKLVGEKGTHVPKIALANINVTAVVRVAITLVFHPRTKKWSSSAQQFQVQLLSFKGPVGLGRTIVGTILSLVVPMIREKLVDAVPHEIGFIVKVTKLFNSPPRGCLSSSVFSPSSLVHDPYSPSLVLRARSCRRRCVSAGSSVSPASRTWPTSARRCTRPTRPRPRASAWGPVKAPCSTGSRCDLSVIEN